MKTTLVTKVEQSQMQILQMEPHSKSMEEEVKNTKLQVGVKSQVAIQNESTKAVVEQPKAQDVVQ